jgi:hypothetical protein
MKKKTKYINYIILSLILILIIYIIYNIFNKKIENFKVISDHEDIIFYSYGSEYDKFKTLVKSATANNINIHINGIGVKWKDFSNKLENFHKFLENVNDNKIVMCLDAYDVIIFDNAENILNKFKEFDKPLVFSAEIYCWPDKDIYNYYPEKTKNEKFKFVNAGTYMGYAWRIKEMLNEFRKTNYNCLTYDTNKYHKKVDDQRCLTRYYLDNVNNKNDIALDHKQKIWSLCAGTKREDYDFDLNTFSNLYNKSTNEKSSILHTNSGNSWYQDLYV